MRHFYIFNINKELIKLTNLKDDTLYSAFNSLYNLDKKNIYYGINMYDSITRPFDKKSINKNLFENMVLDNNYTKFMYTHVYNNYFDDETSKLTINNSFFKLDTTSINSVFFNFLKKYKYLFVCDFENKDYFWLESIA